jgi:uncharacterized lipoprotein YehR (DUF1307 family)
VYAFGRMSFRTSTSTKLVEEIVDVVNVILGMAMFMCSQKIIFKNYGDEHQGVVAKVPIIYKNLVLVHQIHREN